MYAIAATYSIYQLKYFLHRDRQDDFGLTSVPNNPKEPISPANSEVKTPFFRRDQTSVQKLTSK